MHLVLPLLLAASEIQQPVLPLWALEMLAKALLGAWLFCLGACVGSFLNVVVYRLPLGKNLVHPGSHCPACGHAIRPRDNIPLLGWLLLAGKCRDCRAPISPRYYYVELIVAIAFLLLAAFTAFLSGHHHNTALFWCGYGLQVTLLSTLIAAALIDADGRRTPWRLFVPVLLAGAVLAAMLPPARSLPLLEGLDLTPWQIGLVDGGAGLMAGLVLGGLVELGWLSGARQVPRWMRSAPLWMLASVGLVVGWQRVAVVAPLGLATFAVLVGLLRLGRSRQVVPLAGIVAPLVAWMLSGWAAPLDLLVDLIAGAPLASLAAVAAGTAAVAFLAGKMAHGGYFLRESPPPSVEPLPPIETPLHEPPQPAA